MPVSPLAALIVKARRARTALPVDTALAPSNLHAALAIQAEVAAELGETPAGWKVGFTPEGAAWAAPIFAGDMREGAYTLEPGEVVKVEGELGVRFARDLPVRPGKPYTRGLNWSPADTWTAPTRPSSPASATASPTSPTAPAWA
jgi:2-keto-4-pentenoate hydratase